MSEHEEPFSERIFKRIFTKDIKAFMGFGRVKVCPQIDLIRIPGVVPVITRVLRMTVKYRYHC